MNIHEIAKKKPKRDTGKKKDRGKADTGNNYIFTSGGLEKLSKSRNRVTIWVRLIAQILFLLSDTFRNSL